MQLISVDAQSTTKNEKNVKRSVLLLESTLYFFLLTYESNKKKFAWLFRFLARHKDCSTKALRDKTNLRTHLSAMDFV